MVKTSVRSSITVPASDRPPDISSFSAALYSSLNLITSSIFSLPSAF